MTSIVFIWIDQTLKNKEANINNAKKKKNLNNYE